MIIKSKKLILKIKSCGSFKEMKNKNVERKKKNKLSQIKEDKVKCNN